VIISEREGLASFRFILAAMLITVFPVPFPVNIHGDLALDKA
jgi:hypothetical protein